MRGRAVTANVREIKNEELRKEITKKSTELEETEAALETEKDSLKSDIQL